MIPAERFYIASADGPLRQGDILLAGVARLVGEDRFTPAQWSALDAYDVTLAGAAHDRSDLRLTAGPALVMVASHDCHFDKEWNRRREALIRGGVLEDEAERQADADEMLDRTFNASPLINLGEIEVDRGNLVAGRVIGYLPVPRSPDELVPEAVVDLGYRVTLDRFDVVRVASISEEGRTQLRYALARLDSLRTPSIGFEIETVVGRSIQKVTFPKRQPLAVRLHLDSGEMIDLLQQPSEPGEGPARRSAPRSR